MGQAVSYAKRSLDWRLRRMELTSSETELLSSIGITNTILQKYHTWRYSSLVSAILFIGMDALFSIPALFTLGDVADYYNEFGQLATFSTYIAELVLAITAGVSLYYCRRKPSISVTTLAYGWLVSTLLPLWPLLVPVQYFLKPELRTAYLTTVDGFLLRASVTVYATVAIFPAVVAIPSGLIRGSMRVRGLLPEGSLAGWLVVAASPLFPLVAVVIFASLAQAAGDLILLSGAIIYMLAPFGFLLRRRLLTKPSLTDKEIDKITNVLRTIGIMQAVGMMLIVIWILINVEVQVGILGILRFLAALVGRLLVTTLVFAEVMLNITATNLKETREAQDASVLGESQSLLQSFELEYFKMPQPNVATPTVSPHPVVVSATAVTTEMIDLQPAVKASVAKGRPHQRANPAKAVVAEPDRVVATGSGAPAYDELIAETDVESAKGNLRRMDP